MNDLKPLVEINIRAPRYFIARARGICRHCNEVTDLFGLAVPAGHETSDVDEAAEGTAAADTAAEDAAAADTWTTANDPALIFHIEFLNPDVAARLAALTGSFRVDQQESAEGPAWTNHCGRCGSSFDDEELFCEPGEPFFPISESRATAIRLLAIDAPFEAAAGGYSFDPNFFDAMSLE